MSLTSSELFAVDNEKVSELDIMKSVTEILLANQYVNDSPNQFVLGIVFKCKFEIFKITSGYRLDSNFQVTPMYLLLTCIGLPCGFVFGSSAGLVFGVLLFVSMAIGINLQRKKLDDLIKTAKESICKTQVVSNDKSKNDDKYANLEKLNELKSKGILTETEFQIEKKKLLAA